MRYASRLAITGVLLCACGARSEGVSRSGNGESSGERNTAADDGELSPLRPRAEAPAQEESSDSVSPVVNPIPDDTEVTPPPMVCAPGSSVQCACPGDVSGVQQCLDDGSRFDMCRCPPPPPPPPPPDRDVISYAAHVEPIILMKCSAGACHAPGLLGGPGMAATGARHDLSEGVGYTTLTTLRSIQVDLPFVGQTAKQSYLWYKVTGNHEMLEPLPSSPLADSDAPTGLQMPFTPVGGDLTREEEELIRQWIESGAAP